MKSAFLKFWEFLGRLADESERNQDGLVGYAKPPFEALSMTSGAGIPLPENDFGLSMVNRWAPPPADPGQWDSPWDR